jgi:hypothetical protein
MVPYLSHREDEVRDILSKMETLKQDAPHAHDKQGGDVVGR